MILSLKAGSVKKGDYIQITTHEQMVNETNMKWKPVRHIERLNGEIVFHLDDISISRGHDFICLIERESPSQRAYRLEIEQLTAHMSAYGTYMYFISFYSNGGEIIGDEIVPC